jgi:hypothetical protein
MLADLTPLPPLLHHPYNILFTRLPLYYVKTLSLPVAANFYE